MKDISLLVWLTQLGLSVALPLAGFVLLAVWLHNSLQWGVWVIFVGVILGLISAIYMNALRMMIFPLVFCSIVVGIKNIGSVTVCSVRVIA